LKYKHRAPAMANKSILIRSRERKLTTTTKELISARELIETLRAHLRTKDETIRAIEYELIGTRQRAFEVSQIPIVQPHDYQIIACALFDANRRARGPQERAGVSKAIKCLSETFASRDTRFDRKEFMNIAFDIRPFAKLAKRKTQRRKSET